MSSRPRRFLPALALLAFIAGAAHAQTGEGKVRGVVRDSSGAGIPGVLLTITNQATGTNATATSSADGSYTLNVAPGVYSVNAALKGFGRQTKKDL
jgi:hypothetical protein